MKSSRLAFGTWSTDDVELAAALWGDTRVTRFVGGPFSEQYVRERLESEIANQASRQIQYWPIFHSENNTHLGCCGLRPYSEDGVLELGFYLRPEHWGHGYASEAAKTVMEHAFTLLQVAAIVARHHPQNADSRKVIQRLGFRYVRDEYYAPTGLMHPAYSILRETSVKSG